LFFYGNKNEDLSFIFHFSLFIFHLNPCQNLFLKLRYEAPDLQGYIFK